MSEKYKLALVLGRFQCFHKGHEEIVKKSIELADKIIILIGSAQESGTEKNPFSFETRKTIIRKCFPQKEVLIYGIDDMGLGNNKSWGNYVVDRVFELTGIDAEVAVSGEEERRNTWYEENDIAEVFIPKTVDVSATQMRQWLIENNRDMWCKYTNAVLHDMYDELRTQVLKTIGNCESRSI